MKNRFLFILQFTLLIINVSFISCKNENKEAVSDSEPKVIEDKFEDGPLSRKYTLIQGKKEGKMIEYYHTGEVLAERNFINDQEEGKTIFYFKNGDIKEVLYLVNGEKNGGDTIYYEDGSLKYISTYKDGIRHGLLRKWDEDGDITYEAKFNMDTLIEVGGKPVIQDKIAK